MCINSLPTISIEKPPQKVIYLDTNMMIEMARAQNGKCNNTYAKHIAKTYQVLTSMMTKKYILCPLGNQFSEMRNARMRQSSTNFLFHFTNSDFLSPAEIEHTQLDIGYEAFTAQSQIIELNCASYFTPNILSPSPYRIVLSPKYSPTNAELFRIEKNHRAEILNKMKSAGQTEFDFESQLKSELSAPATLFLDALNTFNTLPQSAEAILRYANTISEVYGRIGLTSQKTPQEFWDGLFNYYSFLTSAYHHNLPTIWIQSVLWAHRMQRKNKIKIGDYMDTIWAAAYLPFIDYAITDSDFCDLLKTSGLAEKYNVKVYSFKSLDVFLSDIFCEIGCDCCETSEI